MALGDSGLFIDPVFRVVTELAGNSVHGDLDVRLLIVVMIVAAGVAGWFVRGWLSPAPGRVEAEPPGYRVTRGRMEETVNARGIVKPAPNALVRVGFTFPRDVTRRIKRMSVVEGDHVEPGSELAVLDYDDLQAALDRRSADLEALQRRLNALKELESVELQMAEAELGQRKAESEQAERDLKRAEELRNSDLVSSQQRESAMTAQAIAKSRVELSQVKVENVRTRFRTDISIVESEIDQARAAIQEIQVQIRWSTLRSPLQKRAQVYSVQQRPGEAANGQPDTPVLTLLDIDQLQVNLFIDEADFGRIQSGQKVTLRAESYPDRILNGRILRILPQPMLQENVVYYIAVAEVEQEQRSLLRVDMTVLAQVQAAVQESTLWVPIAAVRSGPEGWYVLRRKPNGHASETPVRIGWKDQGRVEVRDGLAEGDEVLLGH